jgi:hypothetical protein
LPRAYAYLLGLYLGDGSISTHPRGVYKLRIFLDRKYPEIVGECGYAMARTMPDNKAESSSMTGNESSPTAGRTRSSAG